MVPAVKLGAADEIVQGTQSYIDIAVLEESINRIEHKIKADYIFANAQNDKGKGIEEKLQCFFDRMKPADVNPVEFLRGMMDGVKSPEKFRFVMQSVKPVSEEVRN